MLQIQEHLSMSIYHFVGNIWELLIMAGFITLPVTYILLKKYQPI